MEAVHDHMTSYLKLSAVGLVGAGVIIYIHVRTLDTVL